ncbi:MAG: glycosyltransferase family 2 protein [Candidatus Pacearchaeota archaeon]
MEFITVLMYIAIYFGLFTTAYYLLSFVGQKRSVERVSEKKLPSVTILIPAHNEEDNIKKTVESALELDYPKDRFEIIILENGSKDKTYEIAKEMEGRHVRAISLKEGGKANALNYGTKLAKGEIIITMDADTYAEKDALKNMIYRFTDDEVVGVASSMVIHNPKGFWQRIQKIEYLIGVYLRKAFKNMDAIHITPGAFSAYKKSFLIKHGGFDVGNITEDLELSLRIQYLNLVTECADDAVVYTKAPDTFRDLLIQRRRWYAGLSKNLWKYKGLFSKKYGELGLIVLPVAVMTVLFSIIITSWLTVTTLINLKNQIDLLFSVNFDVFSLSAINKFVFERFFIMFFSNPLSWFTLILLLSIIFYLYFAKGRVKKYSSTVVSFTLFTVFFGMLFAFWWIVSLFYAIFVKKISW